MNLTARKKTALDILRTMLALVLIGYGKWSGEDFPWKIPGLLSLLGSALLCFALLGIALLSCALL